MPLDAPDGQLSAIVQKASTQALADGTTRVVVPLSFPLNDDTQAAIMKLMRNVKETVVVAFGFPATQARLDFPEPQAATLQQHAQEQGIDLHHIIDSHGDTYFAHRFMADGQGLCSVCEAGADHEIHSAEAQNLRERMREELTAVRAAAGEEDDGPDPAIQAAYDEAAAQTGDPEQPPATEEIRREPADADEAAEQALAEAALAGRSKVK